jgi:hypothetical protein
MWKPLLAAAGGALVGFWVAKSKYEKEAYAYANERIEQAKAYAEERADRQIQKSQAEASVEALDAVTAVFEQDTKQMEKLVEDNAVVAGLIQNYQGFSTPAPSTAPVGEDSESHIILIRRKEFFERRNSDPDIYDQTTVTWYPDEDILYDDMGQKQLDVQAAVGNIRGSWFGNEADDENVCYVRNTKLKIEWEVIRSQGSFRTDVLGLGGDDEPEETE